MQPVKSIVETGVEFGHAYGISYVDAFQKRRETIWFVRDSQGACVKCVLYAVGTEGVY